MVNTLIAFCTYILTRLLLMKFFIRNDDLDPDFQFYVEDLGDSQYYHPNGFTDKYVGMDSDEYFSNIHFNARSLPKNIDSIKMFLRTLKFSFNVIGISETWIKQENPLLYIPSYTFVSKSRQSKSGGGVAIYIRETLSYYVRDYFCTDETICDSLFFRN